jgi:hypothetical protein
MPVGVRIYRYSSLSRRFAAKMLIYPDSATKGSYADTPGAWLSAALGRYSTVTGR